MAERALVDEAQVGAAVLEAQAYPEVLLLGRVAVHHEQLAAHPQVGHERLVRARQREPQVFATALGGQEHAALEAGGELVGAGHVTADRAGVEHLGAGDLTPGHPLREAAPDDLDLRQLRHFRPRPLDAGAT